MDLNDKIDQLEQVMLDNFAFTNCHVEHRFTNGLYVRELHMPKGTLITSKIHKTQHQYFVLQGSAIVWIDGVETLVKAPFIGVTEPNTRRVLYILEDSIWATSHPNPHNENVEQIEERIIEKHDNPYLTEGIKTTLKELLNHTL